ncbi:MAG: GspH/FimT family pseudopilin [Pirellulales bacterium]|nr:GspH/FimT family pseudopilin [Pirellulales bacterium]
MRSFRQAGFSFIELVIVMMMIGILLAAAAPKYMAAHAEYRCNLAAKQLAADLRFAASEAERTSQSRQVQFDLANDIYTLTGVNNIDHASQPYVVDLKDTHHSVDLVSADFNGDSVVTFDMFGRPNKNGMVVVQSGTKTRSVILEIDGSTSVP